MENNELDTYSTAEKITAVVIIIAILVFPAKLVYYDTYGTDELYALKIVLPITLAAIVIAIAVFKNLREALFISWLRLMVYMPFAIIGLIVLGIIYYFFQAMFQGGDAGPGE